MKVTVQVARLVDDTVPSSSRAIAIGHSDLGRAPGMCRSFSNPPLGRILPLLLGDKVRAEQDGVVQYLVNRGIGIGNARGRCAFAEEDVCSRPKWMATTCRPADYTRRDGSRPSALQDSGLTSLATTPCGSSSSVHAYGVAVLTTDELVHIDLTYECDISLTEVSSLQNLLCSLRQFPQYLKKPLNKSLKIQGST